MKLPLQISIISGIFVLTVFILAILLVPDFQFLQVKPFEVTVERETLIDEQLNHTILDNKMVINKLEQDISELKLSITEKEGIETSKEILSQLQQARLSMQQNNLEKAMFYVDNAIELNPDNSVFWYDKAIIYFQLKNYEKAHIWFTKTLPYHSNNAELLLYLGLTLIELGNCQDALNYFNEAISIESTMEDMGLYFKYMECQART